MSATIAMSVGHVCRAGLLGLAGLTCLVGLLAPLTPSEGQPRLSALLVFLATPFALSLSVALSSRATTWRVLGLGLATGIAGVATWLFTTIL